MDSGLVPCQGQRDSTGLWALGQKKVVLQPLGFFFRSKQATLGVP